MRTFEDLRFKRDKLSKTHAKAHFQNGYGISVVQSVSTYSNHGTYEVAILKNRKLCCTTPITDDVLGYQTPEQITEIMKKLQKYEKNQY